MTNKKLQEKLAQLRKKTREIGISDGERYRIELKKLSDAKDGLDILSQIAKVPEIMEHAQYRYIYVAEGGFGDSEVFIKEDKRGLGIYTSCQIYGGQQDYSILDKDSLPSLDGKVLRVLREVKELGKDKILERILDGILNG